MLPSVRNPAQMRVNQRATPQLVRRGRHPCALASSNLARVLHPLEPNGGQQQKRSTLRDWTVSQKDTHNRRLALPKSQRSCEST